MRREQRAAAAAVARIGAAVVAAPGQRAEGGQSAAQTQGEWAAALLAGIADALRLAGVAVESVNTVALGTQPMKQALSDRQARARTEVGCWTHRGLGMHRLHD